MLVIGDLKHEYLAEELLFLDLVDSGHEYKKLFVGRNHAGQDFSFIFNRLGLLFDIRFG